MYPKERPGRDRHRPGPDTEEATSMQGKSTPALRCDHCGQRGADGIDEHGQPLCDGCARGLKLQREGRREHVGLMVRAAIAGARATNLAEADIREVIAQELDGLFTTRLEEDVPRNGGWADGGDW